MEAVSNGVNAFAEPKVRHAHGTLATIVIILGLLLLGIAHVARGYGVMAMDQTQEGYQSVLSQLAGAVSGRGWFYYVTIGSVLAVLCLSANTSFVDFPRLCHLVAEDDFLPHPFAVPGRRLVYSVGILFLAAGAGGLLTVFGGITDRLIPLFAVGAFLSFTLSQAGMAAHWWRRASPDKLKERLQRPEMLLRRNRPAGSDWRRSADQSAGRRSADCAGADQAMGSAGPEGAGIRAAAVARCYGAARGRA